MMHYVTRIGCVTIGRIIRRRLTAIGVPFDSLRNTCLYDEACRACVGRFPSPASIARAFRGQRKLRADVVRALISALEVLDTKGSGDRFAAAQLAANLCDVLINHQGKRCSRIPRLPLRRPGCPPSALASFHRALAEGLLLARATVSDIRTDSELGQQLQALQRRLKRGIAAELTP